MDSRSRLLASINHKQPDKVPIDLGSSTVTGISAIAYNNLKAYLNISSPTRVFDVVQQLANVDMKIIDMFGVDALDINRVTTEAGEWYEKSADGSWYTTDADGLILSKMPVGAAFYDQMFFPYQNGYPENFENLKDSLKKISWVVHSHASNLNATELREKLIHLKKTTNKALLCLAV
jgi:uroporphyrinogen decarboxylase